MAASVWTSAPTRSLDLLSDERLARLAARGDERAFGVLFARHQAGLTRYCRTILRHQADAEDAAQNGLVAAHRALTGGTIPMRVKPWLYKIAHNEALGLARSRRPAEALDEAALPAVADAEEAGEVRRRLGQLLADLRALTERQREALVLRELCGLGYAEIAQTLGSSEAAAQQTVFEARSALQQFGEGRALDCEGIQRALSDCDGRRLRTRTVRAHLRGCARCQDFEAALLTRRRDLGLLFPPSGAVGGALAALGRFLGGGGGESLLAGLGIKGAAVGLAVLAGGGAVVATSVGGTEPPPAPVTARPAAQATTVERPASGAAAAARPAAGGAKAPARAARRASTAKGGAASPSPQHSPGGPHPQTAAVSGPGAPAGTGDAATTGSSGAGGGTPREASSGGSGGGTTTSGSAPHATRPSPVQSVADTVTQVTQTAGGTVQGAVDTVTDTASGAVDTATGAVGQVTTTATDAAGGVVDTVTNALPKLP